MPQNSESDGAFVSTSSLEKLRDVVSKGIAIDIYFAEEALFLDEFIGANATSINDASFGQFFGSHQNLLGRELILATNRVFEHGNGRYSLRSIPGALKILEGNTGSIEIQNRTALIDYLVGKEIGTFEELDCHSDAQLTEQFVEHFRSRLPNVDDAHELSPAIGKLKTVRDKRLAHHESVESDVSAATYAEIQQLLEIAKEFLSIMGSAYLSTAYQFDDGDFPLTSDARRSTTCLYRLLQQAGIEVDR